MYRTWSPFSIHHQPVEPFAGGLQGRGGDRGPAEIRARGLVVDDAHAGQEVSRQRLGIEVSDPVEQPAREDGGAGARRDADRRVPVFACVALLDLHRGFSIFSLWTAALFSFLLAYMVIVAHADMKKY